MAKQIKLKDEVLIIEDCSSCPFEIDFGCILINKDISEYRSFDENDVLIHEIPNVCKLEDAK